MEYPRHTEHAASRIAREVCGGAPEKCSGWKAKIYSAAWSAAARALVERDPMPAEIEPGTVEHARILAEQVLLPRLTRCAPEKRPALLERIAKVRAGLADTSPEVQSAILALESSRDGWAFSADVQSAARATARPQVPRSASGGNSAEDKRPDGRAED